MFSKRASRNEQFALCTPVVESGSVRFKYWDPTAEKVWLVTPGETLIYPMSLLPTEGNGEGHWEVVVPNFSERDYAFVVEWLQILHHTVETRFGVPSEHLQEFAAADDAAAPADAPAAEAALDAAADELAAQAAESAGDEAWPLPPDPTKLLGDAEILIQMDDMACMVADGGGARLRLHVAPRLQILTISAAAADGSWGPCALSSAPADADAGPGVPAFWGVDLPEHEMGCGSIITVQVRRRDWRVDPFALSLWPSSEPSFDDCAARGGVKAAPILDKTSLGTPPPGPPLWSALVPAPPAPASFSRCADWELVVYEIHVGSFTAEGTFRAAQARLGHVRDLGCTALSVMPVHQDFRRLRTGEANMWGYDIISFCAVDPAYGTPADLAGFVAAAHSLGLVSVGQS